MSALICGSIAYDTVMVFPGRFQEHILPDKIHMLNVSFLAPSMRRNFGGCAGNIAYNLKLLGGSGAPMGTVGHDFGPYEQWLRQHGITLDHLRSVPDEFTAQAYITTDLDDNQITAFHPGAMTHSHLQDVPADSGYTLAIVSPDGRDGMLLHARQLTEAGIPFLFDPGQALPLFNGAELLDFVERARWVAVNDYESEVLTQRTGLARGELAARVEALFVTRGAEGSCIYTQGRRIDVPPVAARTLKDPTGCGDAYRAGLIYGLMRGLDWETTGRIASLMGAIKIEAAGTQNHSFTPDEFVARFHEAFGFSL
ncbi:MAG TPA: carbohydrate kinase family protein [Steroidobacteraceae bacterium]|nr:carbohydrate kinase family protein [Steroidobacteraceae bacterium]